MHALRLLSYMFGNQLLSISVTVMGCVSSNKRPIIRSKTSQNATDLRIDRMFLQSYQKLDISICTAESECPSVRLDIAEAWVSFLQEEISHNENTIFLYPPESIEKIVNPNEYQAQDIAKLALQLGILGDPKKAKQQEGFFANLSKRAEEAMSKKFYSEILNSAQLRVKELLLKYQHLSSLYDKLDSLIVSVNGKKYFSSTEEILDAELDEARNVRDKLGGIVEQWRICGFLLFAGLKSSIRARESWKQLCSLQISETDRITGVLSAKIAVVASIVSLKCAQLSLPNVELKYISDRQVALVDQVSAYMITDVADESRFQQTMIVLENYSNALSRTILWFRKTYEVSLKTDFESANEKVKNLAIEFRNNRTRGFVKYLEKKISSQEIVINSA